MAANSFRPPKPWTRTENETVTSYASWHSNLLFHLRLAVYLSLSLIHERLPSYVSRVMLMTCRLSPSKKYNLNWVRSHSPRWDLSPLLHYSRSTNSRRSNRRAQSSKPSTKPCSLWKAANRSYKGHDIASCWPLQVWEAGVGEDSSYRYIRCGII